MEGLSIINASKINGISLSITGLWVPRLSFLGRPRTLSFVRKHRKFIVFASKDEGKLDPLDQMELKFGRLLGEDPKLTLAKIMGRKLNPDLSSLEVEKLFGSKKGEFMNNGIEEVPFDVSQERKAPNSLSGLNLARPVPKEGVKFEAKNKPVVSREKKPNQTVPKAVENTKGSVPNVILRKPAMFDEDDSGNSKPSRLMIKPNLSLNMGKGQQKERFSDIVLLKKPEPVNVPSSLGEKDSPKNDTAKTSCSSELFDSGSETVSSNPNIQFPLQGKPKLINHKEDVDREKESSGNHVRKISSSDVIENRLGTEMLSSETANLEKTNSDHPWESGDAVLSRPPTQGNPETGIQPLEQSDVGPVQRGSASNEPSEAMQVDSSSSINGEASLQGKPERLDLSMKGASAVNREEIVTVNHKSYSIAADNDNLLAVSAIKEHEDIDWTMAENLVKTGSREEVELINSSTRGFVASFGSLIGFLPYRNLGSKWKFLAFESWLRRKGLDPSMYRKNLGLLGSEEVKNESASLDSSVKPGIDLKVENTISPDMKLGDLLRIYEQEKHKFLSSFVGQKVNVNILLANRKSRRLVFSIKPKEKEELVEKKRDLMAKLSVGDVVKCCIKKITYFGIFVEVEGVPALVHQTEVSWDATLDLTSYFKIGQIVEAKVHQLDFSQERIFLSLKEVTPDPLMEALEAVVGDQDFIGGKLEVVQADTEWIEMESLIRELQQFEGIQSVSKGRYFLSPGLAPTFQVYMASMFEDQYKLLARSGNKVQELIVQTSLGKEEMKSAILVCTNRVA